MKSEKTKLCEYIIPMFSLYKDELKEWTSCKDDDRDIWRKWQMKSYDIFIGRFGAWLLERNNENWIGRKRERIECGGIEAKFS
jgi:hypothetical protein